MPCLLLATFSFLPHTLSSAAFWAKMASCPYPSVRFSSSGALSPSSHQSHCRVLARVLTDCLEGQKAGGQAEAGDTAAAAQGSVSSPSPGPLGQRKPRQEGQCCHQPERPMKHPPPPPAISLSEPQCLKSSFGTLLRPRTFCSLGGHMPSPIVSSYQAKGHSSSLMLAALAGEPFPRHIPEHALPFRKSLSLSDHSLCCSFSPYLLVLKL